MDGFILRQVLQWHHLLSARTGTDTVAGLEHNTLADGIFHLAFLGVLLLGAVLIVEERVRPRAALGLVLIGWGVFHPVDQLVFHLALGAHHIREDAANPALYDWGFFGIGLALIAAGWALGGEVRGPRRAAA